MFDRIFFAVNAVRLVSFLFTLYSKRMFNTQVVYADVNAS